jgi:hypothetical protein
MPKLDMIDAKARVWTVTRGPDGKLCMELDRKRLAALQARDGKLAA